MDDLRRSDPADRPDHPDRSAAGSASPRGRTCRPSTSWTCSPRPARGSAATATWSTSSPASPRRRPRCRCGRRPSARSTATCSATPRRPACRSCARPSPGTTGAWHGIDVSADDVVVTTGSSGGFLLAFLAAFEAGDRVAIARPGYPCYRNVLTALGCEVVELPTGPAERFQPTVAMLEELVAAGRPVQGLVVASPANPTGTMLLPEELAALAAWCEAHGVQLVSDEIYHGITYDGGPRVDRDHVVLGLVDQPRGDRVLVVLEVLLHDRVADRLDDRAAAAAPGRRRAGRQLHDLPAGAGPAGRAGRLHARVVRRVRRARAALRGEPRGPARRACAVWASTGWLPPTARSTCTPTSATSPTTPWPSPTGCSPETGVALAPGIDFDTAEGSPVRADVLRREPRRRRSCPREARSLVTVREPPDMSGPSHVS